MKCKLYRSLILIVLILGVSNAIAKPHQALNSVEALDQQIEATLVYLSEGKIAQARLLARQMAWRFPDFALGQLIYADLSSASAFRDVSIAEHMPMDRNVTELLLEAQRRLNAAKGYAANGYAAKVNAVDVKAGQVNAAQGYATGTELPPPDIQSPKWPASLIQAGKHLSQLVVADLNSSVLYSWQLDQQHSSLVHQHYIGSGEGGFGKQMEGDLKTPLGVYTINGSLSDAALPDLYGAGALTLDYPNTLDQYLGRTGYGIWLHGVPSNQLSRTPYSSEGCVTMSNQHLQRLAGELDPSSTRVILTDTVAALDSTQRDTLANQFQRLFEHYQQAWIDGSEKQLTSLYADQLYLRQRLDSGFGKDSSPMRKVTGGTTTPGTVGQQFEFSLFWQAFGQIQPEDVSIFLNPELHAEPSDDSSTVIIDAIFGSASEYQITTYWSQNNAGEWQVLTETVSASGL